MVSTCDRGATEEGYRARGHQGGGGKGKVHGDIRPRGEGGTGSLVFGV